MGRDEAVFLEMHETEKSSGYDFYFEPTNFWYAESSLNQTLDLLIDLQTKIQNVVNMAGILESPYSEMVSSANSKFNTVIEEMIGVSTRFANFKSSMLLADPNLELLFLYMDMTGGEINLEDPSELLEKSPDEMTKLILEYYLEYYDKQIADLELLERAFGDFFIEFAEERNLDSSYIRPKDMMYACDSFSGFGYYVREVLGYTTEEAEANGIFGYGEENKQAIQEYQKWVQNEYTKTFNEEFYNYMCDAYEQIGAGAETFEQTYPRETFSYDTFEDSFKDKIKSDLALFDNARYDTVQDLREVQFKIDYPIPEDFSLSSLGTLTIDEESYKFGILKFIRDGKEVSIDEVNPVEVFLGIQNGTIPASASAYAEQMMNNPDFIISANDAAYLGDALYKIFTGKQGSGTYVSSTVYENQLNSIFNDRDFEYLNNNQLELYSTYYSLYGKDAADAYLDSIRDTINQQKGMARASEEIAKATDENGNIDWSKVSIDGVSVGIENFGEGIYNVLRADGIRTDSQYMQMYYMQYLTNSSGLYVQDLVNEELNEYGAYAAEKFYNNIINSDGSINLEWAKSNLSEDEYQLLITKINNDKNGFNTFCYEMGSTVGNMLPTTLLSLSLSWCPMLGSVVGQGLMGASAFGNSTNEALISGHDLATARYYGLLSAVSEIGLSAILGNIPGLNPSAKLSLMGFISEGSEEFLQEYISAGIGAAVLGERIDLDDLNEQALKSFLYGFILSAGMNTTTTAGSAIGTSLNLYMDGKSVNLSNPNSILNFISVLNNGDIKLSKMNDGSSAFVMPIDANIDISMMQELFPGVPILRMDGEGKNAQVVDMVIDGVVVKVSNDGKTNSSTDLHQKIAALKDSFSETVQSEDTSTQDTVVETNPSTTFNSQNLESTSSLIDAPSFDTGDVYSVNDNISQSNDGDSYSSSDIDDFFGDIPSLEILLSDEDKQLADSLIASIGDDSQFIVIFNQIVKKNNVDIKKYIADYFGKTNCDGLTKTQKLKLLSDGDIFGRMISNDVPLTYKYIINNLHKDSVMSNVISRISRLDSSSLYLLFKNPDVCDYINKLSIADFSKIFNLMNEKMFFFRNRGIAVFEDRINSMTREDFTYFRSIVNIDEYIFNRNLSKYFGGSGFELNVGVCDIDYFLEKIPNLLEKFNITNTNFIDFTGLINDIDFQNFDIFDKLKIIEKISTELKCDMGRVINDFGLNAELVNYIADNFVDIQNAPKEKIYEIIDLLKFTNKISSSLELDKLTPIFDFINKNLIDNVAYLELDYLKQFFISYAWYYANKNGLKVENILFSDLGQSTYGSTLFDLSGVESVSFNSNIFSMNKDSSFFGGENVYIFALETLFHEFRHVKQKMNSSKKIIDKYTIFNYIDEFVAEGNRIYYRLNYNSYGLEIDARVIAALELMEYLKKISPEHYDKFSVYIDEHIDKEMALYNELNFSEDDNIQLKHRATMISEKIHEYIETYGINKLNILFDNNPWMKYFYNLDGTRKKISELFELDEYKNDTDIKDMIDFKIKNASYTLEEIMYEIYDIAYKQGDFDKFSGLYADLILYKLDDSMLIEFDNFKGEYTKEHCIELIEQKFNKLLEKYPDDYDYINELKEIFKEKLFELYDNNLLYILDTGNNSLIGTLIHRDYANDESALKFIGEYYSDKKIEKILYDYLVGYPQIQPYLSESNILGDEDTTIEGDASSSVDSQNSVSTLPTDTDVFDDQVKSMSTDLLIHKFKTFSDTLNFDSMIQYVESMDSIQVESVLQNIIQNNDVFDRRLYINIVNALSFDQFVFAVKEKLIKFDSGYRNDITYDVGNGKTLSMLQLLAILNDQSICKGFIDSYYNGKQYFKDFTNQEILKAFRLLNYEMDMTDALSFNLNEVQLKFMDFIDELSRDINVFFGNTTLHLIDRNSQGLTEYSVSCWQSNFNRLTIDQKIKFDECIQFIGSLNYNYSNNSKNVSERYGLMSDNNGMSLSFDEVISKVKLLLNESGITYVDEQFLVNLFNVAPTLVAKNATVEGLNQMIQRLISDILFTNGEKVSVSNIEDLAHKMFGEDLTYIDIVNHPENRASLLQKLNDYEVRVLYNYNEFCILRKNYAPHIDINTWISYNIQEQVDIARRAYNDRNALRTGSQGLGIGENVLPATGTNPLMTTFEGGFVYNFLKFIMKNATDGTNELQIQFFTDMLNNGEIPASIKEILRSSKGQIINFIDNLKISLKDNGLKIDTQEQYIKVSEDEIKLFYDILLLNPEYSAFISEAAKSIIKSSYTSNQDVNSIFGIIK